MSYIWAKVYIEILDDHKMGLLQDNLWRRVIELILLAKKHNQGGFLPGMMEMAWVLRISTEQLETELRDIESKTKTDTDPGIVHLVDGNWFLTNFAKRQAADSDAERAKNYRTRSASQERHESVTKRDTDKTRLDIPSEAKLRAPRRRARAGHKAAEPKPPAVLEYRHVARTWPDKATWDQIANTVGDESSQLKWWGEVVTAYIALGWNKRNVSGMLEWFSKKELPHLRKNGNSKEPEPVQIKPAKVYR